MEVNLVTALLSHSSNSADCTHVHVQWSRCIHWICISFMRTSCTRV